MAPLAPWLRLWALPRPVVFNVGDFVINEIWGTISVSRRAISASRLKHTQMFNWFQKINICYSGINAFDARLTLQIVTKAIKHISDWSRISQTTVTWFCATLHCTKYPRPLRLWLVGFGVKHCGSHENYRATDVLTWKLEILTLKFTILT